MLRSCEMLRLCEVLRSCEMLRSCEVLRSCEMLRSCEVLRCEEKSGSSSLGDTPYISCILTNVGMRGKPQN